MNTNKPDSAAAPSPPDSSPENGAQNQTQKESESLLSSDKLAALMSPRKLTPEERAREMVDDLDFECRIGEERWEIEDQVHRVGSKIGALFAVHLEKNPPSFLPKGVLSVRLATKRGRKKVDQTEQRREFFGMHVEMLFNFIYLFREDRQRSITRYSERLLEQLLIESSHELGHLELLKEPLFYAIFEEAFRFLETLGIPVRATLRAQQLRRIHKRMLLSDLQQFAMN